MQNVSQFLQPIVGEVLSSVTFTRDYVQLAFDGPLLTAYAPVTVVRASESWTQENTGWRDAICEKIGATVKKAISSDAELRVDFEDGTAFAISLDPELSVGPEMFTFRADDKPLVVG